MGKISISFTLCFIFKMSYEFFKICAKKLTTVAEYDWPCSYSKAAKVDNDELEMENMHD